MLLDLVRCYGNVTIATSLTELKYWNFTCATKNAHERRTEFVPSIKWSSGGADLSVWGPSSHATCMFSHLTTTHRCSISMALPRPNLSRFYTQ
ncbi:hypothetical protein XENTR_v10017585 [Xenopus tropicalis]|nr:hypothetical protein XENTR_v10017585 [Xenopus tropicalis]